MTDNFHKITEYLRAFGKLPETKDKHGDYFFDVLIVRRGKDHPDLPAANYTFAHYYYDNFERFLNAEQDIKAMCDLFKSRAYVSATIKRKDKLMTEILCETATRMKVGDQRVFNSKINI